MKSLQMLESEMKENIGDNTTDQAIVMEREMWGSVTFQENDSSQELEKLENKQMFSLQWGKGREQKKYLIGLQLLK